MIPGFSKYSIGQEVFTVAMGSSEPPSCKCCGHPIYKEDDVAGEAERLLLIIESHVITGVMLLGSEHPQPGVHYAFHGSVHWTETQAETDLFATREEAEEWGNKWLEDERRQMLAEIKE